MISNYFWVRVFDYNHERDSNYENESYGKGIMLDEFYLKDIAGGREEAKQIVKERYIGQSSQYISFAKPRKKDGMYAIVMESNQFFYDRFTLEIDTFCFWDGCHKPIKGKVSEFPRSYVGAKDWDEEGYDKFKDSVYFCSHDCRRHFESALNPYSEGEFQEKEEEKSGNVFGYIYLIYNRLENSYYIGQTRFLPFFRWQEHIKDGQKGDIKDLTFSVLTEVSRHLSISDRDNQVYLNNIEAWWIMKYQDEGYKVFNISKPRLTLEYFKTRFDEMVLKNKQLSISGG